MTHLGKKSVNERDSDVKEKNNNTNKQNLEKKHFTIDEAKSS